MAALTRTLHKTARLPRTARTAALHALLLVEAGDTAQAALARTLATPSDTALSAQDRHLCSELVYGSLRHELRLGFLLRKLLPRPAGLPPEILVILRFSLHSLLFLHTPHHAVVHSAVELARALAGQAMARLVNAVLRSVQRLGDAVLQEDFYLLQGQKGLARLAAYYSLPACVCTLWQNAYGESAALALMRRSLSRPWTGVRLNSSASAAAWQGHDLTDLRQEFIRLAGPEDCVPVGRSGLAVAPGRMPQVLLGRDVASWQQTGLLSMQSAASQLVLEALGCLDWTGPVWDACAGYGGKSHCLLESGRNVALATDVSRERLAQLPRQCHRLAVPSPLLALSDASRPCVRHWQGHILADVPCSGLGVLARRPDLRKRLDRKNIAANLASQRAILDGLADLLKPGRELAYITCTLNPAENEDRVQAFLARHKGFSLVRQWQTPHEHPWLEGMYGAVLRKD